MEHGQSDKVRRSARRVWWVFWLVIVSARLSPVGQMRTDYDDDGRPTGATAPIDFVSDADEAPGGIISDLRNALRDAGRLPVLKLLAIVGRGGGGREAKGGP